MYEMMRVNALVLWHCILKFNVYFFFFHLHIFSFVCAHIRWDCVGYDAQLKWIYK